MYERYYIGVLGLKHGFGNEYSVSAHFCWAVCTFCWESLYKKSQILDRILRFSDIYEKVDVREV